MAWLAAGFVMMALAMLYLEVRQPFYFSEDDNFSLGLPYGIFGLQSVIHGKFPTYDPYQYAGAPLQTIGCWMHTYPFFYLAYGIGAFVLHNAGAGNEILCIGHLTAGYIGWWTLARRLRVRASLATLAALTIALGGYSLIAGRAWANTTPVAAYTPIFFVLLLKLQEAPPNRRWLIQASLALALFMNAGFVQLCLYAIGFSAIWLVSAIVSGAMPVRRALWVLPPGLIAAASCFPQALSFRLTTQDWMRNVPEGAHVTASNLLNILLPAPLAPLISAQYGSLHSGSLHYRNLGEIYYSGTTLAAFGLLAFGCAALNAAGRALKPRYPAIDGRDVLRAAKSIAGFLHRHIFAVLALCSLLLSFGDRGPFWHLLRLLPLMNKMESPFKFMEFFAFFSVIEGALAWEHLLFLSRNPRRATGLLMASSFALLTWNVFLCTPAFYSWNDRPYPKLPVRLAELLSDKESPQRIYSVSPKRSTASHFPYSLTNDWATFYGYYSLDGYDPAVEVMRPTLRMMKRLRHTPHEALRAYGVRWIVVHRTAVAPVYGPNPTIRESEHVDVIGAGVWRRECAGKRPVYSDRDVAVYEVAGPDPMAFLASDHSPLAMRTDSTGITVTLPPGRRHNEVVINFLLRPGMIVTLDGHPAAASRDRWDRIVVRAPGGARTIAVRYPMPWRESLEFGTISLVMGILLALALTRVDGRSFGRQSARESRRLPSLAVPGSSQS